MQSKDTASNTRFHTGASKVLIQWIPVNWSSCLFWGKSWRTKTNREYNQNLLCLFGAPCHLIGPVTATWHACDSENDVILEMHHVGNSEEFSRIDNSLQCYNENEDCEDTTVKQIAVKHQNTRKPMRMT
jgi:hypothetical protein